MAQDRKRDRIAMKGWVAISASGEKSLLRGCVSDVSFNGICVYARKSLRLGTSVRIRLEFFGRKQLVSEKELKGSVAWSFKHPSICLFGILFQEPVAREKFPALYEFLENATRRRPARPRNR